MKIHSNAFRFCKITVTLMVWTAFVFKMEMMLILMFGILLFSAMLKIRRAPMILLYTYTFEKVFPSKEIEVHEKGMRFAHTLGALLSLTCLLSVYFNPTIGWWVVLGFAILKTLSMIGFCPGEAIYSCYENGSCSIFRK